MKPVTYQTILKAAQELSTSIFYQILILIIAVDLITGYSKAYKTKSFDSKIGTNGMIKHINVLVIQTIVGIYTRILGFDYFSQGLCVYFISIYGLSVLENLDAVGLPLPENFREYFNQMRNRKISIPNADIIIKSNTTNSIENKEDKVEEIIDIEAKENIEINTDSK